MSYNGRTTWSGGGRSSPDGARSGGGSTQGSSAVRSSTQNNRGYRRMTDEEFQKEFQKHRNAGTCYRCGQRFSPTHRCPSRTLNILIVGESESDAVEDETAEEEKEEETLATEDETQLQLSVFASHGFDGPQTIKLMGTLGEQAVVLMVDSGATHCFVAESLIKAIGWPVDRSCKLAVGLGDGSQVKTRGICREMPIRLNGELYLISCYVFSLRNVDFILGVSWLASLGEVNANWAKLTLKFERNGKPQLLLGDPSRTRRECSPRQLRNLEVDDRGWWLLSLEGSSRRQATAVGEGRLEKEQQHQIETLLLQFKEVSSGTLSLPPTRLHDHRITLQPGSGPISVKPYRYNQAQKDEMERLVAEMLEAGTIQSSNSPFSSPVLLVKKKDGSWRFCVDYRRLNAATVPDRYPIAVLQRRSVVRDGISIPQVLIQWEGEPANEATWLDVADVRGQFPFFSLEDKAVSGGEAIDRSGREEERRVWRVYKRGPRRVVEYGPPARNEGEDNMS